MTAPYAMIYVDGEELLHLDKGDDFNYYFKETIERFGGEVALLVWKPRHNIYLRAKLSYTAPKLGLH